MDILGQKKELRKRMFDARAAIPMAYKKSFDRWVNETAIQLIQQKNSKVVHVYIPMLSEIDIRPLISQLLDTGVTVVAPKTLRNRQLENRILLSLDHLETGIMGTQHPANPAVYDGPIDLIIVPGMAFDAQNYRLGYGGGYYDNFIVTQPAAFKLGIFYPVQQVEKVPTEAHDICLDHILTHDWPEQLSAD